MNTPGQRIAEKLKRKFPLSLADVDREELVAIISAEIAPLVEALRKLLPYLSDENQARDHAALNEGRASSFDVASLEARAALAGQEPEEPKDL